MEALPVRGFHLLLFSFVIVHAVAGGRAKCGFPTELRQTPFPATTAKWVLLLMNVSF
jgi:hypothetical protein